MPPSCFNDWPPSLCRVSCSLTVVTKIVHKRPWRLDKIQLLKILEPYRNLCSFFVCGPFRYSTLQRDRVSSFMGAYLVGTRAVCLSVIWQRLKFLFWYLIFVFPLQTFRHLRFTSLLQCQTLGRPATLLRGPRFVYGVTPWQFSVARS